LRRVAHQRFAGRIEPLALELLEAAQRRIPSELPFSLGRPTFSALQAIAAFARFYSRHKAAVECQLDRLEHEQPALRFGCARR
jgi:hypothetical protein